MTKIPTEYIHEGKDGWLFVISGTNNPFMQYKRTMKMRKVLRSWKHLIRERYKRSGKMGIRYVHVVVPEKLTVYDSKLRDLTIDTNLSPALRLRRSLWFHPNVRHACLDLVRPFRAVRDARQIYFKTDSHWTFEGRLVAYRIICEALGAAPRADFEERPAAERAVAGDLGMALRPPRREKARFRQLQRDAVRSYASPIVLAREAGGRALDLHVGANVVYRNESAQADGRTLVLFGDSYSAWDASMLTIMLAETFREVHFVWSASVDWSYVERVKPDILMTEIAERFMWKEQRDTLDLDAYVRERYGGELESSAAAG